MSEHHKSVVLKRNCRAVQIPSGFEIEIAEGTEVIITQSLGGTFTVASPTGLAQIAGKDADALGLHPADFVNASQGTSENQTSSEQSLEDRLWEQLKTCYDPEIPVNIVDLGLVYDCQLIEDNGVRRAEVKMTLTAPGCGMGPVIASEAEHKLLALDGVDEAKVELVWDPPWSQTMISEAGRMKLGMV